jgi:hypothetical protein
VADFWRGSEDLRSYGLCGLDGAWFRAALQERAAIGQIRVLGLPWCPGMRRGAGVPCGGAGASSGRMGGQPGCR